MAFSIVSDGGLLPNSGKGLHAKDGKAKIRPALEKLCEEYVRGFILLTFIISVFSPWSILSQARLYVPSASQECWGPYCPLLTQRVFECNVQV
jgi:hypothetical protein